MYTIDPTWPGDAPQRVTVPLKGTVFGVDFSPAADRLRIVSDTGQNLSHNVNRRGDSGPGPLTYTPPPLCGAARGITAAAYTNNDLSANTATTLLISTRRWARWRSNPRLGTVSSWPRGRSGSMPPRRPASTSTAFLQDGVTVANVPFATLAVNGTYRFYAVDLTTGQVSS